jgi:protein TonB
MTADGTVQTADLDELGAERWAAAPRGREYRLWVAAACALMVHAGAIFGMLHGKPRYIGDPDGSPDTVTVSLITDADFKSKTTVPVQDSPPPAPAAQPSPPPKPPPQPEPKPPEETKPPEPTPAEQPPPEPPKPPEPEKPPEPQKAPEPAPKDQALLPSALDEKLPDLFSKETGKAQKSEKEQKAEKAEAQKKPPPPKQKTQPAKKRPQKMSKLDLSMPSSSFSAPGFAGGGSAAFARPPGITRSGANDDFARGVIRALQETMPQLRNTLGRVTVRIFLNQNGNLESVQLLRSSKNSMLDRSVVFATKQTSYPLPPGGSNVADRTFVITYIYE